MAYSEQGQTPDEQKAQLRRKLLYFYLRHPIGRKIVQSWYADAAMGKIGPGDFLDHKYRGIYTTFLKRCTELAVKCGSLKFNTKKKKLYRILNEMTAVSRPSDYGLAPKDILLVTLGACLQSKSDFLNTKPRKLRPFMRLLSDFSVSAETLPDLRVMDDITIRYKKAQSLALGVISIDIDSALKTPSGYPILLDDYSSFKKYPALRKYAHAKNLRWRTQLADLASAWGYRHVTKEINQFLDGKIIGGPGHYLGRIKPFAADVCRYLNQKPDILFAGAYPPTRPTPPAATSMALAKARLFLLPEMLPVLLGLADKDIHTKHDLITALRTTKKINQASIYRDLPDLLNGKIFGSRGAPTKLACLVAEIAGYEPAIYAMMRKAPTGFIESSPVEMVVNLLRHSLTNSGYAR